MTRTLNVPKLEHGHFCYYIPLQSPKEHGGFVPSLVIEDEAGHYPMLGAGKGAAPWVWGQTMEEAEEACVEINAQMGIDRDKAARIVASSMAAGMRGRRLGRNS